MGLGNPMKLEFLPDGSIDCPLIRLYDFTQTEAGMLLNEISRLVNGNVQRVALHEMPWVESLGGCRLTLCIRGWHQSIFQTDEPAEFECGYPAATWDNVAALVEPFACGDAGGYQWLTGAPGEAKLLLSVSGEW